MILPKLYKKGSATDSIWTFMFLFIMVFFALIFLNFLRNFGDGIIAADVPAEAKTLIGDFRQDIRDRIDNVVIMYFFILVVGSWISSYFLDNHPLYFVIFMVLSFMSFFIVLPFANVIYSFEVDATFMQEVQYLPKTFWLIEHTAAFLSFYIITTAIVLYAKNKFGNKT